MSLLEVNKLSVSFHTRNGVQQAVKNLDFRVDSGEILGIVGESGSGKSVSCYSLLGLIPCPPGRIDSGCGLFKGQDLLAMSEAELRAVRGNQIAMIFQDPMTSLNPFLRVGEQLIEPLVYHRGHTRAEATERAQELLDEVGIRDPKRSFFSYPHEFSGGMRQRVMIASALIAEPELLIADEPTTALDVTVQAQILQLISELQNRRNLAVVFISHDLAVVKDLADRVVVMKQGECVESGPGKAMFAQPQHPYTQDLYAATPQGAKAVESSCSEDILLEVNELRTVFPGNGGAAQPPLVAVDDASFVVYRGEILGLVGESGSGKSTLGRSILNLVQSQSGSVRFEGSEIRGLPANEMRPLRKQLQMIFQDPYASLNPRMTIYDCLAEPLLFHKVASAANVQQQVLTLMDEVGLDRRFVRKYPHEFSGGQRQRIAIARALASEPEFIVADEPVSALDVTIQKQILELLLNLVERRNLTMLFISHDLAVVRYLCDRVLVMQHGKLLESGATESVWQSPAHPYTQKLLASAVTL